MDKEAFDTLVRFNLTPHKTLFNTFQYIHTHIHTYTLVDEVSIPLAMICIIVHLSQILAY